MASIKGKLFEFFVYRLLVACGFKPVIPDDMLVYRGSAGLMVQGLGQPHNADVLLSPPIQTPFYYPTRLIVECKCYGEPIGLPQIRNALGLRDDVNNFEIITEDILKNRRYNRSKSQKYYPMKRYVYQVAVASIDGFRSTAFPFAQAHRIPLISFAYSSLFEDIRQIIDKLDNLAKKDEKLFYDINDFIDWCMHHQEKLIADIYIPNFQEYLCEIDIIERRITIGLLEDGTLLFLMREISEDRLYNHYSGAYMDGYTIHWNYEDDGTWVLRNQENVYRFELPKEIYRQWKCSVGEQRKSALRIKEEYLSKIVLFHRTRSGSEDVQIIRLSEMFMMEAERTVCE